MRTNSSGGRPFSTTSPVGSSDRGIHGEQADALERHAAREDPRGTEREVTDARAPVHQPDELVTKLLG